MAALPNNAAALQVFYEKLQMFPPQEILQMCCLSRRSGELCFGDEPHKGYIYLQQGEVIHSTVGPLQGEDAVFEIMVWPQGNFIINEGIVPSVRTINQSIEQLQESCSRRMGQAMAYGMMPDPSAPNPGISNMGMMPSGEIPSTGGAKKAIDLSNTVPRLTLYGGTEQGRTFELTADATHLGRAPENDITIADTSVSGRHCVFILNRGSNEVVVRDLNSSNGTFVNGQPIAESSLQIGDIIRVGTALLKFELGIKRPKLRLNDPAANGAAQQAPVTSTIPNIGPNSKAITFEKLTKDKGPNKKWWDF